MSFIGDEGARYAYLAGKSINGAADALPAPTIDASPAVYAALPMKTSDWDSHSVDYDPSHLQGQAPPPPPPSPPADNQVFWTPEQMAVLSQQPLPYDHYYAHVSTQPGKTPEGALAATPPPPVPPQQYVPGDRRGGLRIQRPDFLRPTKRCRDRARRVRRRQVVRPAVADERGGVHKVPADLQHQAAAVRAGPWVPYRNPHSAGC